MYQYVLFDWNGTLLDDLRINIEIENHLLEKRGLKKLPSKDFYLENFDFPIKDFYEFCGFDFTKESYDDLCDEYTAEYTEKLKEANLFGDAVPVFEKLKSAGIKLVIISATKESVLKKQVASFGIESYFESIIGTKNLHGSSKIEAALSWFSANKINAAEAVFIGDTTHDSETAEAIDCECFLVCRGHNSKTRLENTERKVFTSLEEAANEILKAT